MPKVPILLPQFEQTVYTEDILSNIIEDLLKNQGLGISTKTRKTTFEYGSKLNFDDIKFFRESKIMNKSYNLHYD